MSLTAAEQYLLELMNRARLDPAAEAARHGIALNQGLASGQISTAAQQVLAPNIQLESAATGHSLWMLSADVFSHTGSGGSTPGSRATGAGYDWDSYGENVGMSGTTGTINQEAAINEISHGLFLSATHRVNTLNATYREVGLSAETGVFTQGGANYNTMMVTQLYGLSGSKVFLTGVAYTERDADALYSIGEGRGGVVFTASGYTTQTAAAGGYALALDPVSALNLTGKVGTLAFAATVNMAYGNVKLDVVNGDTFHSSGTITLVSGIQNVTLLGIGALKATGNASVNKMTGGAGANTLDGMAGNDILKGMNGNDRLNGGDGNDNLSGDLGNDDLRGGAGADALNGSAGIDKLYGEAGNDKLTGGSEADTFVFATGICTDTIADFSIAQRDVLLFDNALWGNTAMTETQLVARHAAVVGGHVVFDFGGGQVVHLTAVTSTNGLAAQIDIF